MTAGNPRCATCDTMLYTETRHTFGSVDYCLYHCPQCTSQHGSTCDELVARAKRGRRRGTPKAWAMRGISG